MGDKVITIQISKYLTDGLARKIAKAQWRSDAPEWVNRIRRAVDEDDYFVDCFGVVAVDQDGVVIGRLYCIQSEQDRRLWYYRDLFVLSACRRMGIAARMIGAAIRRELGAGTLRAYAASPKSLISPLMT